MGWVRRAEGDNSCLGGNEEHADGVWVSVWEGGGAFLAREHVSVNICGAAADGTCREQV